MTSVDVQSGTSESERLSVTWRPSPEQIERSRLKRLMDRVGVQSYADLVRWSVEDVGRFWDAVAGPGGDLDLRWQRPYERTLDIPADRGWAWTTWWRGGHFNYVHASVDRWS